VAIMDWYGRTVPARRVSNTMDVSFCVSALEDALALFGNRRSSILSVSLKKVLPQFV
jgi:transposase InsO family protein